ncbi:hypothetical protein ACFUT3_30365 [Streptomyces cinereoruber]|uniref:hypothetical protein n=1 Tax=Streptomyces cinereoruber TaxID=67260 RepID=UPI0036288B85
MAVSLYKGFHLWSLIDPWAEDGEGVKLCRLCGTILEAEEEPYSKLCTVLHDGFCKCVACAAVRA